MTGKFTKFVNNPPDNTSISGNTVFCIIEDDDKILWISTNAGVNKFDKKAGKFRRYVHSDSDSNTVSFDKRSTLLKDRNGNIFVGTRYGLNKYIKASDNFRRIHLVPDDSFEIMCISQDSSGILWMGTHRRGIFKYDDACGRIENIMPEQGNSNSLASNAIRAIVHGKNGLIWIAHVTDKAGLDILDTKTGKFYNFKNDKSDSRTIGRDVIWEIYKDRQENMWICTNGGGLAYYSDYTIKFNHINKLKGENFIRNLGNVWYVIYVHDRFWCQTDGSIISFTKTGEFIKEYTPTNTGLRLFAPLKLGQKTGRFYTGDLESAVAYYDSAKDKFIPVPIKYKNPDKKFGFTRAIFEDKEGNLWLGTADKGLVKLDKDFNEVDIPGIDDSLEKAVCMNFFNGIYQDSKNYLWFGGEGLARINLSTGELINLNSDESSELHPAGGKLVSAFVEDGRGFMWVTYKGSGFDRMNMNNYTFRHFNNTTGLLSNYVLCALPDISGNLWFGTTKGLIKFNTEKENYTNYDISDGIQDEEFNDESCCRTDDGMLAFGGVNGLNWFYPERIKTNTHVPPIAFTSFRILYDELKTEQDINYTEEIELSYRDNFFALQFAALDYVNPGKNQYKYILEGVDKDWVNSGNNNEAKYTDISPGDYVFKVKGSNNDGVWNEQPKTIKIIIVPPWWKRWWFRIFASISILGFIFYGVNKRISAVEKQKQAQEEFSRILISSQEQERKKLSAELHDSVGQDIVIIKNNANMALNSINNDNDAAKYVKQISELSASALNNVRSISHNLRPVELDRLGLTETIKSIIELVSNSIIIKFVSEIDDIDNLLEKGNEVNFCRIIQESMNNILKHSLAKEASIKINKSGDNISTVIRDNGIGFDTSIIKDAPMHSVFGLTGINERVKMLNGTLEIKSGKGEGTEIIINIPYVKSVKKSL